MSSKAAWWRDITGSQWRALVAALVGWMLDAMDMMLFTFALNPIRAEFQLTGSGVGSVAAAALLTSAAGGILFGFLADRYGRARALSWSILIYSFATALTATSRSLEELLIWRMLLGIGMGGEWSAGAVLVAETWPAEHRGKAIGIMQSGWAAGYLLAALLSAAILPSYGWRWLFLLGALPALLAVWIRRQVEEPKGWRVSKRGGGGISLSLAAVRGRILRASLLTSCVLFAYWGLFTWLPAYLGTARELGGAGLSIVKTSAWMVPVQIGALFGYLSFGFLADRFGRRPVFITFVLAAAVLVPVYGWSARWVGVLLVLGPLMGFFGHGYFSVFGAMLAELFPVSIRGTAQGLSYNVGRAASALAPVAIGMLADRFGIGPALGLTSAFFIAGAGLILCLPETKAVSLS